MRIEFDRITDFGGFGECQCHIVAVINSDQFWESYHLVLKSATIEFFGDMDISPKFTRQLRSEIEEEVIEAYKQKMEMLEEQQQERRAARGRVVVEAWV